MTDQVHKILLRVPRHLFAKMQNEADQIPLSMNAWLNRVIVEHFEPPGRDDEIADLKSRNASLREFADGLRDALVAQQSEYLGALAKQQKQAKALDALDQRLNAADEAMDERLKAADEAMEAKLVAKVNEVLAEHGLGKFKK